MRSETCAHAPRTYIAPYSRISRRPLPWQVQGLQYTATGYGRKIPTDYVIQRANERQWRRVYCTCYSNSGTLWIRVGGVDFAEVLPDYRVPELVPDWPASVPVWDAAVVGSGGGE